MSATRPSPLRPPVRDLRPVRRARREPLSRRVQYLVMGCALASGVYLVGPASPLREPSETLGTTPAVTSVDGAVAVRPKPKPAPVQAKGIIMSGFSAGSERFNQLVRLIDRTELNAVVLDVKDESGRLSWIPKSERVRVFGAGMAKMRDPAERVRALKDQGIYVIGRIVVFRDPALSHIRPDLALQDTRGGVWQDEKGNGWADPYSAAVWEYNLEIAREAVATGFDEIQFDYIRFPADGDLGRMWHAHRDARSPTDVIHGFLARARRELSPLGVWLSADVFGLVTLVADDLGIGQSIERIAQEVDYLSLMLYPSHYNKPEYDIDDPEREPYKTVSVSLADAKRRIEGSGAKLRPWLQDFSLAVPYTPAEVRAQIKAAEDAGVNEWLLWNANNRYTEDALRPEPKARATPAPRG